MSESTTVCDEHTVSYSQRVYDPGKAGVRIKQRQFCSPASTAVCMHTEHTRLALADSYDWCIVPDTGYDVILLASLAVVVACLCQGRLSNLMVLIAGELPHVNTSNLHYSSQDTSAHA